MRPFILVLSASCFLAASALAALSAEREAVFAGGCFWSVEKTFDAVEGVGATVSGFSGGDVADPTYRQVVAGGTGHVEAVKVSYDPAIVSYGELLDVFWRSIDPTDPNGQFCDRGEHYRTVVFVSGEAERAEAEASKAAVASELGAAIATRIEAAAPFYAAGDEHQDFHRRNADHYERYRIGCGRDAALQRVWGTRAFLG